MSVRLLGLIVIDQVDGFLLIDLPLDTNNIGIVVVIGDQVFNVHVRGHVHTVESVITICPSLELLHREK